MSKHKMRRQFRWQRRKMLRDSLDDEKVCRNRLNRILLSNKGENVFEIIKDWERSDPHSARALQNLVEQVVHPQSARSCLSLVQRATL